VPRVNGSSPGLGGEAEAVPEPAITYAIASVPPAGMRARAPASSRQRPIRSGTGVPKMSPLAQGPDV
jgi:hypothetical protein